MRNDCLQLSVFEKLILGFFQGFISTFDYFLTNLSCKVVNMDIAFGNCCFQYSCWLYSGLDSRVCNVEWLSGISILEFFCFHFGKTLLTAKTKFAVLLGQSQFGFKRSKFPATFKMRRIETFLQKFSPIHLWNRQNTAHPAKIVQK